MAVLVTVEDVVRMVEKERVMVSVVLATPEMDDIMRFQGLLIFVRAGKYCTVRKPDFLKAV